MYCFVHEEEKKCTCLYVHVELLRANGYLYNNSAAIRSKSVGENNGQQEAHICEERQVMLSRCVLELRNQSC